MPIDIASMFPTATYTPAEARRIVAKALLDPTSGLDIYPIPPDLSEPMPPHRALDLNTAEVQERLGVSYKREVMENKLHVRGIRHVTSAHFNRPGANTYWLVEDLAKVFPFI